MNIYIASDHAGFELKEFIIQQNISNLNWKNLGPASNQSVDYPDFADLVCKEVQLADNNNTKGILICGSGQGMAMRANKFEKIRAALCWNSEIAKLSRQHNNANILCLPARFITQNEALKIIESFLSTPFEGGRHEARVQKLMKGTI